MAKKIKMDDGWEKELKDFAKKYQKPAASKTGKKTVKKPAAKKGKK